MIATVAIALSLDSGDDEVERSTWAYEMVQLEQAWEMGITGEGVRVGIVDTGIDPGHPSLDRVRISGWTDLINDEDQPYDDMGHGTAMASIIAGRSPLRGGATGVELIVVKVLDQEVTFNDTILADGIDFCMDPDGNNQTDDGAHIISLSLGGEFDNIDILIGTATHAAISQAVAKGIVVVAAAGNDGTADDVMEPSRTPDVISVGAVDQRGQMAPFSSRGDVTVPRPDPNKKPEVVAPGVDIVTAHVDGLYAKGSGTSHATAMVSAALAVALSYTPDLLTGGTRDGNATTVRDVKTALMETARSLEGQATPHDPKSGYGMVQAVDLALALEG
ncbi:MAG: S8 family serine peptidase [Thermoplasmata archaeon]|nr:MAG: S8 family serine peptidase [Thermoplasmata archaeon]